MTLTDADLNRLKGLNDPISLSEVAEIYLPLSRLLSLYVAATQGLHEATRTFLGTRDGVTPYIIGLAGLGGGRQIDDRTRAAGAAPSLAQLRPRSS